MDRRLVSNNSVLVTGAFGLVGRAVVESLVSDNYRVIATAHRATKPPLPASGQLEVRTVDLTRPAEIESLIADVSPSVIAHLAANTPPLCYVNPTLARAVNVDATDLLIRAASQLPSPPRFIYASSTSVYGARNPHRYSDVLTADTPIAPSDLYGAHKAAAEEIVRSSDLAWCVLRLGGVIPLQPIQQWANPDFFYFDSALPADSRIHSIDVRDVARAIGAAITTNAVREVFMIAGDDSHKQLQGDLAKSIAAAIGLEGALLAGSPGDPRSHDGWATNDWMDTARAQHVLSFQQHSFPDMIADIRRRVGWRRNLLRASAPFVRAYFRRTSPDQGVPGRYADPWHTIRAKWGDPHAQ